MLPRLNRLKKGKDFKLIITQGKVIKENFLFFKKIENDLGYSRIGFIVSQKISKKAVVRNKIKRRLREIIRLKLPIIKPGYDFVFFAKKGIENKKFPELKKTVENLIRKARLINVRKNNELIPKH